VGDFDTHALIGARKKKGITGLIDNIDRPKENVAQ
jgi:hypothetical protein